MGAYTHLSKFSDSSSPCSPTGYGMDAASPGPARLYTQEEIPWKKWRPLEYGIPGTAEFRMGFVDGNGCEVSPWHNIPLHSETGSRHYMCTTPKNSDVEFLVDQNLPIPQLQLVQRNGSVTRFNIPPPWNVGILPQTLSDSKFKLSGKFCGLVKDGCPLKVLEIGSRISYTGEVCTLKPLYVVSLTEGCILSRIIVAIDVNDALAPSMDTLKDVDRLLPGTTSEIANWLVNCNQGNEDNSKRNLIHLFQDKFAQTAMEVIAESHAAWQLFADSQPDWLIGTTDYGKSIWRNYKIHVGKSNFSFSDLSSRELKYDRAWFTSLDMDDLPCAGAPPSKDSVNSKKWRKKRESRVADDSKIDVNTLSTAETFSEALQEREPPECVKIHSKRSISFSWCFSCIRKKNRFPI